MSNKHKDIRAIWLGPSDFMETWTLQKRLAVQISEGLEPETLLLLEHNNVYTLGRRGTTDDILLSSKKLRDMGIEVHHIDRGGQVTYHGPGQLVAYTILNVKNIGGPLRLICALQETMLDALSKFGISANCANRPTGVWVEDSKIGAIGLRVSKGYSTHGFALNVSPDLKLFDHIIPCGMTGAKVTSLEELSVDVSVTTFAKTVADSLGKSLKRNIFWAEQRKLH